MTNTRWLTLLLLLLCSGALLSLQAAGTRTIEGAINPPAGFTRLPLAPGSFPAALRQLELSDQKVLLAGDGKTPICDSDRVAITTVLPYNNTHDVGVDGIVRLWGEHLWKTQPKGGISFPLDNGQIAEWKDWRDGLRPKKAGGRYIFTQVTTPNGSYANYQDFLSFVAEEMGAIALKRESTIITYDDSLTVGDVIIALRKDTETRLGVILDACKGPRGEKLFLLGTCGTPSTNLYVMRPYAPVQGVNEWFTLEGARWAVGEGDRTDLRRVMLK
ncbi:MAG TPA: DUF4846 domain-containing protein [bacterium]|jgi:hypothetical protein